MTPGTILQISTTNSQVLNYSVFVQGTAPSGIHILIWCQTECRVTHNFTRQKSLVTENSVLDTLGRYTTCMQVTKPLFRKINHFYKVRQLFKWTRILL